MVGMYLFSTVTALVAAAVLSRTLFKARTPPLILDPKTRAILRRHDGVAGEKDFIKFLLGTS
jgi:hypothetical protein